MSKAAAVGRSCTLCNTTWRDGIPAPIVDEPHGPRICSMLWGNGAAEVVVAHCSAGRASAGSSLDWIPAAVVSINASSSLHVARVVIYSKCGAPYDTAELPDSLKRAAQVVEVRTLPNVGRNDHTYAHHIANEYHCLPPVSFLMKGRTAAGASPMKSESASMAEMSAAVMRSSFACAFKTDKKVGLSSFSLAQALQSYKISTYHTMHTARKRRYNHGTDLGRTCTPWAEQPEEEWRGVRAGSCAAFYNTTARLPHVPGADGNLSKCRVCFKSAFRPLGAWVNMSTVFTPPQARALWATPVWRICFGGSFATHRRGVWTWPRSMWQRLSDALARADSIEEGHYVERLWGALLAPPLSMEGARALMCSSEEVGLNGLLGKCTCGVPRHVIRAQWKKWSSAVELCRGR